MREVMERKIESANQLVYLAVYDNYKFIMLWKELVKLTIRNALPVHPNNI